MKVARKAYAYMKKLKETNSREYTELLSQASYQKFLLNTDTPTEFEGIYLNNYA